MVGELRLSRCPLKDRATDHLPLRELRRAFLDQLAYVCDHVKDGDTVTAIALEALPSGVTFGLPLPMFRQSQPLFSMGY